MTWLQFNLNGSLPINKDLTDYFTGPYKELNFSGNIPLGRH